MNRNGYRIFFAAAGLAACGRADLVFDATFDGTFDLAVGSPSVATNVGSATLGQGYSPASGAVVLNGSSQYVGYNYAATNYFNDNNGLGANTVIAVVKPGISLASGSYYFFGTGTASSSERILLRLNAGTPNDQLGINTLGMGSMASTFTAGKLSTSAWYMVGVSWNDLDPDTGSIPVGTLVASFYLREIAEGSTAYYERITNSITGTPTSQILTNINIGVRSDALTQYFNGAIDLVQGYDTSFSKVDYDNVYAMLTVPEPTSIGLLGLAGAALWLRRRGVRR